MLPVGCFLGGIRKLFFDFIVEVGKDTLAMSAKAIILWFDNLMKRKRIDCPMDGLNDPCFVETVAFDPNVHKLIGKFSRHWGR